MGLYVCVCISIPCTAINIMKRVTNDYWGIPQIINNNIRHFYVIYVLIS